MYTSCEFLINKKRIIIDVMVILCAAAVYVLNAVVLKPFTSGVFNYFAVCYLNDFMSLDWNKAVFATASGVAVYTLAVMLLTALIAMA